MLGLYKKLQIVSKYWRLRSLVKKASGKCCQESCRHEGDRCSVVEQIQVDCKNMDFSFWEEAMIEAPQENLHTHLEKQTLLINEQGRPCYGKTLLAKLDHASHRFQSHQELLQNINATNCLDGVPKNQSVCQYAWRGEICKLCPMHVQ